MLERASAAPAMIRAVTQAAMEVDLRDVLTAIRVPTIVVAREASFQPRAAPEHVADLIPGAKFDWQPAAKASDGVEGFMAPFIDAVERMVTGSRTTLRTQRVLATVLFTDIVGSTERASVMGDRGWHSYTNAEEMPLTALALPITAQRRTCFAGAALSQSFAREGRPSARRGRLRCHPSRDVPEIRAIRGNRRRRRNVRRSSKGGSKIARSHVLGTPASSRQCNSDGSARRHYLGLVRSAREPHRRLALTPTQYASYSGGRPRRTRARALRRLRPARSAFSISALAGRPFA
jgi:hypothetical protein